MTDDTTTMIARNTARHYARRCWWADPRDVSQIVARTTLEARITYRVERGVWTHYLQRALRLRLGDELLADSAPVSARSGHRGVLLGLTRAPVDDQLPHRAPNPETRASRAEVRDRVRERIRASGIPVPVLAALAGECDYTEAAEALRVSRQQLVALAQRAITTLRGDIHLRALAQETSC